MASGSGIFTSAGAICRRKLGERPHSPIQIPLILQYFAEIQNISLKKMQNQKGLSLFS
jgi:hypothetical protein